MDASELAPSSLELAEAAFAYQIDWRYTDRTAGDVYEAPNAPPALSALMEATGYMWESLNKDKYWDNYYAPIMQTFHASHITQHIMPKEYRPAFVAWFERAIDRAQQHARRPPEPFRKMQEFDTMGEWRQFVGRHRGPSLPPELIDPAVDYQADEREARVAAFLSTLDWRRNRYLRSPDAMRALGFVGNPYPHIEEGH